MAGGNPLDRPDSSIPYAVSLLFVIFAGIMLCWETCLGVLAYVSERMMHLKHVLVDRLREELLALGVVSLVLAFMTPGLTQICVESDGADDEDNDCPPGEQALFTEQVITSSHYLLFWIAVTQIAYTVITVIFTTLRYRRLGQLEQIVRANLVSRRLARLAASKERALARASLKRNSLGKMSLGRRSLNFGGAMLKRVVEGGEVAATGDGTTTQTPATHAAARRALACCWLSPNMTADPLVAAEPPAHAASRQQTNAADEQVTNGPTTNSGIAAGGRVVATKQMAAMVGEELESRDAGQWWRAVNSALTGSLTLSSYEAMRTVLLLRIHTDLDHAHDLRTVNLATASEQVVQHDISEVHAHTYLQTIIVALLLLYDNGGQQIIWISGVGLALMLIVSIKMNLMCSQLVKMLSSATQQGLSMPSGWSKPAAGGQVSGGDTPRTAGVWLAPPSPVAINTAAAVATVNGNGMGLAPELHELGPGSGRAPSRQSTGGLAAARGSSINLAQMAGSCSSDALVMLQPVGPAPAAIPPAPAEAGQPFVVSIADLVAVGRAAATGPARMARDMGMRALGGLGFAGDAAMSGAVAVATGAAGALNLSERELGALGQHVRGVGGGAPTAPVLPRGLFGDDRSSAPAPRMRRTAGPQALPLVPSMRRQATLGRSSTPIVHTASPFSAMLAQQGGGGHPYYFEAPPRSAEHVGSTATGELELAAVSEAGAAADQKDGSAGNVPSLTRAPPAPPTVPPAPMPAPPPPPAPPTSGCAGVSGGSAFAAAVHNAQAVGDSAPGPASHTGLSVSEPSIHHSHLKGEELSLAMLAEEATPASDAAPQLKRRSKGVSVHGTSPASQLYSQPILEEDGGSQTRAGQDHAVAAVAAAVSAAGARTDSADGGERTTDVSNARGSAVERGQGSLWVESLAAGMVQQPGSTWVAGGGSSVLDSSMFAAAPFKEAAGSKRKLSTLSFAFVRGKGGASEARSVSAAGPSMFKLGSLSRRRELNGSQGSADLEVGQSGQDSSRGPPRLLRAMSVVVGRALTRARSLRITQGGVTESEDEEGQEGITGDAGVPAGGKPLLTRSNSLTSSITSDATTVARRVYGGRGGATDGAGTTDGDMTGYTTDADGGDRAASRAAMRAFELEEALTRAGLLTQGGLPGVPGVPGLAHPALQRVTSVEVPDNMVALVAQLETKLQGLFWGGKPKLLLLLLELTLLINACTLTIAVNYLADWKVAHDEYIANLPFWLPLIAVNIAMAFYIGWVVIPQYALLSTALAKSPALLLHHLRLSKVVGEEQEKGFAGVVVSLLEMTHRTRVHFYRARRRRQRAVHTARRRARAQATAAAHKAQQSGSGVTTGSGRDMPLSDTAANPSGSADGKAPAPAPADAVVAGITGSAPEGAEGAEGGQQAGERSTPKALVTRIGHTLSHFPRTLFGGSDGNTERDGAGAGGRVESEAIEDEDEDERHRHSAAWAPLTEAVVMSLAHRAGVLVTTGSVHTAQARLACHAPLFLGFAAVWRHKALVSAGLATAPTGPYTIDGAVYLRPFRAAFRVLDVNMSDSITPSELQEYMRHVLGTRVSSEEVKAMLAEVGLLGEVSPSTTRKALTGATTALTSLAAAMFGNSADTSAAAGGPAAAPAATRAAGKDTAGAAVTGDSAAVVGTVTPLPAPSVSSSGALSAAAVAGTVVSSSRRAFFFRDFVVYAAFVFFDGARKGRIGPAGLSSTLLLHGLPLPPADVAAMVKLGCQGGDMQVGPVAFNRLFMDVVLKE